MAIAYRSKTEIEAIRRAARVVMDMLDMLRARVRPGLATAELDKLARAELARRGAKPNFLGYRPAKGMPPYPAALCASVNDEIVHGIPGSRVLKEGDIITLDMGAIVEGWHGDSAITVPVGRVTPKTQRLLDVTQEALRRGIAVARPSKHVMDVARAIQQYVEGEGYTVVREYAGHGIGRALHEDPWVPNYVDEEAANPQLRPGMVFCIEPMVNAGGAAARELPDRWTVVTRDGSLSAHFEHMVAITGGEPDVLTAR
ncbi:MAG TPA: type I methionyl aminopeptidase [Ktedonobacterales bacterium]